MGDMEGFKQPLLLLTLEVEGGWFSAVMHCPVFYPLDAIPILMSRVIS